MNNYCKILIKSYLPLLYHIDEVTSPKIRGVGHLLINSDLLCQPSASTSFAISLKSLSPYFNDIICLLIILIHKPMTIQLRYCMKYYDIKWKHIKNCTWQCNRQYCKKISEVYILNEIMSNRSTLMESAVKKSKK